jgi:hypothetical protein
MASFVWMLLTEPSYKPNTLMARSLAGEESKQKTYRSVPVPKLVGWGAERGTRSLRELSARVWGGATRG